MFIRYNINSLSGVATGVKEAFSFSGLQLLPYQNPQIEWWKSWRKKGVGEVMKRSWYDPSHAPLYHSMVLFYRIACHAPPLPSSTSDQNVLPRLRRKRSVAIKKSFLLFPIIHTISFLGMGHLYSITIQLIVNFRHDCTIFKYSRCPFLWNRRIHVNSNFRCQCASGCLLGVVGPGH